MPATISRSNAESDDLPVRQQRALTSRRVRRWERQHLVEKVVYRGIDPDVVLAVRQLAIRFCRPRGEVAGTLLEYALGRLEAGFLELRPRPDPKRERMTLFPPISTHQEYRMKPNLKPSSQEAPSWRQVTTWRNFSPELKRTISTLASEQALNVPLGELVNALLRHGLQAYRAGLLNLTPGEQAVVQTLLGEAEK